MDNCLGSLHSGGVGALYTLNGGTPAALAGTFRTYAVEWEAKQIRWYLDGRQFLSAYSGNGTDAGPGWWTAGAGPDRPDAPFDVPFHLLLNLAVR